MFVEVFKTNVQQNSIANRIVTRLSRSYPDFKINFDLDDCDKILRIETNSFYINPEEIIGILRKEGFCCELLGN